jgi:L-amino acid N-acyltransferase YncA
VFADRQETVVGEARYALGGDPAVAELAVSVAADWQGRGLGRLLLCKLISRAAEVGISRLVGETLSSNAAMLRLAHKAGFTLTPSADVRGLVELEKVLRPRERAQTQSDGIVRGL